MTALTDTRAGEPITAREAGIVILSPAAQACREAVPGLINTARQRKAMGQPDQVARLVKDARLFWHWYIREIAA